MDSIKESTDELRKTLLSSSQEENKLDEEKQSNKRLFSQVQGENIEEKDQEPTLKKKCLNNDK